MDELEFYGNINFMKAALVAADKITTVSPTYLKEIQTDYFGEKLNGVLVKRNADLSGILNGIDEDIYNPETRSVFGDKITVPTTLHDKEDK